MIEAYSLQSIDRALYEALRLGLVSAGLLPDVANYTNEAAYEAAKDAIVQGGKQVVEIKGFATAWSREDKHANSIVIDRKNIDVGGLGAYPATQYVKKPDNNFKKERLPMSSADIGYDIRVICANVDYERTISQIIFQVLSTSKYIKLLPQDDPNDCRNFLVTYQGSVNVSTLELIERLFKYTVADVWLEQPELLRDNIVPMTSVRYTMGVVDDLVNLPITYDQSTLIGEIPKIPVPDKWKFSLIVSEQSVSFANAVPNNYSTGIIVQKRITTSTNIDYVSQDITLLAPYIPPPTFSDSGTIKYENEPVVLCLYDSSTLEYVYLYLPAVKTGVEDNFENTITKNMCDIPSAGVRNKLEAHLLTKGITAEKNGC